MTWRVPVSRGGKVTLLYFASAAPTSIVARFWHEDLKGRKGQLDPINITSFTADRTQITTRGTEELKDGWIVGGFVDGDVPLKRGQLYVIALIEFNGNFNILCKGYLYQNNPIAFGEMVESLAGRGFLDWEQLADDIAGNVNSTLPLAATNARRTIRAIQLLYHASNDVATRTIEFRLRDVGLDSKPTGFSISANAWSSLVLTLTADEEGIIYIAEDQFGSINDAGTLTYASRSTQGNPFPLLVEEGNPVDLLVSIGSGEAADDYDVWALVEEWLEP